MGVPTASTNPLNNLYLLLDDYGTSAGPPGGPTGGTSGYPVAAQFGAPTLAAAATVAYLFSSIFQRPVRLAPLGGAPPYTLIVGAAANIALTAVPSGVTY